MNINGYLQMMPFSDGTSGISRDNIESFHVTFEYIFCKAIYMSHINLFLLEREKFLFSFSMGLMNSCLYMQVEHSKIKWISSSTESESQSLHFRFAAGTFLYLVTFNFNDNEQFSMACQTLQYLIFSICI
jgi:hypothetical protein